MLIVQKIFKEQIWDKGLIKNWEYSQQWWAKHLEAKQTFFEKLKHFLLGSILM